MNTTFWIMLCIRNSVVMVCFTVLAVLFKHWWIILFALLFISSGRTTHNANHDDINKKE